MLINLPSALVLLLGVQSAASLSLFHVAREDVKASEDYTQDDLFKTTILNVTNTYRKQHNATALKWNNTLADFAKDWSKKCEFEHSVCGLLSPTTTKSMYIYTSIYMYLQGIRAYMIYTYTN